MDSGQSLHSLTLSTDVLVRCFWDGDRLAAVCDPQGGGFGPLWTWDMAADHPVENRIADLQTNVHAPWGSPDGRRWADPRRDASSDLGYRWGGKNLCTPVLYDVHPGQLEPGRTLPGRHPQPARPNRDGTVSGGRGERRRTAEAARLNDLRAIPYVLESEGRPPRRRRRGGLQDLRRRHSSGSVLLPKYTGSFIGPGCWSPDGGRLILPDSRNVPNSQNITCWDAVAGKMIFTVPGVSVAPIWSMDGRLVLLSANTVSTCWDAVTGKPVRSVRAEGQVQLSPDGKRLLQTVEGTAVVRDVASGAVVFALGGPDRSGPPLTLLEDACSPDGRWAAAVRGPATVLWPVGGDREYPESAGPGRRHQAGRLEPPWRSAGRRDRGRRGSGLGPHVGQGRPSAALRVKSDPNPWTQGGQVQWTADGRRLAVCTGNSVELSGP